MSHFKSREIGVIAMQKIITTGNIEWKKCLLQSKLSWNTIYVSCQCHKENDIQRSNTCISLIDPLFPHKILKSLLILAKREYLMLKYLSVF